jgi:uncharacterized protein YukE
MGDVSVDLDYVESLAKLQDQAAGEIGDAIDDLGDSIGKLWWDHGPICGESIMAMTALAKIRKKAGNNMQKVSEELADKLRAGSAEYRKADEETSDNIDTQMLTS